MLVAGSWAHRAFPGAITMSHTTGTPAGGPQALGPAKAIFAVLIMGRNS